LIWWLTHCEAILLVGILNELAKAAVCVWWKQVVFEIEDIVDNNCLSLDSWASRNMVADCKLPVVDDMAMAEAMMTADKKNKMDKLNTDCSN